MAVTPRELPQDVQEQQCSRASSWQTETGAAALLPLQPSDTLVAGTRFAPSLKGKHRSQAGGARRPAEKGRTRSLPHQQGGPLCPRTWSLKSREP